MYYVNPNADTNIKRNMNEYVSHIVNGILCHTKKDFQIWIVVYHEYSFQFSLKYIVFVVPYATAATLSLFLRFFFVCLYCLLRAENSKFWLTLWSQVVRVNTRLDCVFLSEHGISTAFFHFIFISHIYSRVTEVATLTKHNFPEN